MNYEHKDDYQYNSCIARGICSINPRNSALQTVLVLYLRLFAKFAINQEIDEKTKKFILNTIATTIYNLDFNESSFLYAIKIFQQKLPLLIKEYVESSSESELKIEEEKAQKLFKETPNAVQSIRFGEKVLNEGVKNIPYEIRDLYNIILVIVKSISINLLDLESFDKSYSKGFKTILNLLSEINLKDYDKDKLINDIVEAANVDVKVMYLLREAQEERYGIQYQNEVSFTTTPNKAVLAVGGNIRELENILEAFKDSDIDIYTHDEMMIAHTFPKFASYKNLKGQFGQGIENCLIDFATFPGPIILTKHSLHNVENLYRGLLFTTDYMTDPKGVIKISDNNFSEVIASAQAAKGFKTGKICETITVGIDYEKTLESINETFKNKSFKKVFVIGLDNYSIEQKSYFEKILRLASRDTLIISFSYYQEAENIMHFNTCYDNFLWLKICEFLEKFNLPIKVFIPKCDSSTISQIIYLSQKNNAEIYMGICTPILLNPSLISSMQANFLIKQITNAKKDLEEIYKDK